MVTPESGKLSSHDKFESVIYSIPGPPISWVRVAPHYAQRKMYDTQKNIKLMVGIELASQHGTQELFEGALNIDWRFYMEVPVGYRKKKESYYGKLHIIKPDISNMIKFYEDCCNKIIFNDDCQIATGSWIKVYDEHPRTEFTIRRI